MNIIHKDDFAKYVECQISGVTNMFDVERVCEITGLSREKVFEIMRNYEKCKYKFMEKSK